MGKTLNFNHHALCLAACLLMAGHPLLTSGQEHAPSSLRFTPRLIVLPDGKLREARSPEEWETRRRTILSAAQSIMGPLPGPEKRGALHLTVEEETDCGSYVRQRIRYQAEPGSWVPAYLCLPKAHTAPSPLPAVLCLHPTDDKVGNGVVVGLGGKANRQYAAELAERGFVTLSPAYPHLAGYAPNLGQLGYASGTMKAIWDNIRALDVLDSLPQVQHGRYGAIGHSLGGHNAVYTAVFDPRIQVVISSCGLDSYRDYKGGDLRGWTQERYMPRMAQFLGRPQDVPFDFPELLATLAPRRILISAPKGDTNFNWQSVDRVVAAARTIYDLHGVTGHLEVLHPDCGHDFPEPARLKAYELLQVLRKR